MSDKGWANREIGLKWVEIFDKEIMAIINCYLLMIHTLHWNSSIMLYLPVEISPEGIQVMKISSTLKFQILSPSCCQT